jgi:hypothetical protein
MKAQSLYRYRHIIKQVFPILVVLLGCSLLAGFPSLLTLIATNNIGIIQGTVKEVMCSGITFFLLLLGAMGCYFLTRTDYKHHYILVLVGMVFISINVLGLMLLWNYAYT